LLGSAAEKKMTLCAVSLSGSLWQPPVIGHNSCPSSFNRSADAADAAVAAAGAAPSRNGPDTFHLAQQEERLFGYRFSSSSLVHISI
jgi:hypothetical protein